jgi:hypothetical protein
MRDDIPSYRTLADRAAYLHALRDAFERTQQRSRWADWALIASAMLCATLAMLAVNATSQYTQASAAPVATVCYDAQDDEQVPPCPGVPTAYRDDH